MKKMQRLILIRHGESEGNVDPKIYMTKKDHDVELTEKGRSHSKECGLDLNKILSMTQMNMNPSTDLTVFLSPFKRTRDTWSEIKPSLTTINSFREFEDLRLIEKKWEIFETEELMKAFIQSHHFVDLFYRNKDSESLADVSQRVASFIDSLIIKDNAGLLSENVVIVSHWWALALIITNLKNLKYEDFFNIKVKNCEPIVIDISDTWLRPK